MEDKYPDADMWDDLPAYGLFCRHAETLALDGVHFHLEKSDPRPAMIFDRVEDLELCAASAAPPSSDEAAIELRDVRRGFLHGLRAEPGTKTLFKLTGAKTGRIAALGNDFSDAAHTFALSPEVAKNALKQQANL